MVGVNRCNGDLFRWHYSVMVSVLGDFIQLFLNNKNFQQGNLQFGKAYGLH